VWSKTLLSHGSLSADRYKLKHWLRKAAKRTVEPVSRTIDQTLDTVTSAECLLPQLVFWGEVWFHKHLFHPPLPGRAHRRQIRSQMPVSSSSRSCSSPRKSPLDTIPITKPSCTTGT